MSEVLSRPIPIRIARFLLTEDWYACGTAIGNLMGYFPKIDDSGDEGADNRVHVLSDPNIEEGPPKPIQQLLYDVDGMITWDMAAKEDRGPPVYIPAGYYVKCYQPEDSADGHWEFLKAGEKCAQGSSSSPTSPSSSPSSPSSGSSPSSPSSPSSGSSPSSPSSGSSGPSSASSSGPPSSEGPSSEGPSSEGPSSEGPCACIPNPPNDSGESGELEAVLGAAAADFFWEPSADGNRTLRHGIADRNRQEVYNGTSGTATFFQPEQGVNYKKVLCRLNAFVGTMNFYFPANFTVAPIVTAAIDSGAGLTVTLDSMAIATGTPCTGWYIIEGW